MKMLIEASNISQFSNMLYTNKMLKYSAIYLADTILSVFERDYLSIMIVSLVVALSKILMPQKQASPFII